MMSEEFKIKCQWLEEGRLIIDPDGQVVPCCFMSNMLFRLMNDEDFKVKNPTFVKYVEDMKDMNIHNKTLDEIFDHEWFEVTLPESWKDENLAMGICKQYCRVCDEEER
jgi:hypothetical protein